MKYIAIIVAILLTNTSIYYFTKNKTNSVYIEKLEYFNKGYENALHQNVKLQNLYSQQLTNINNQISELQIKWNADAKKQHAEIQRLNNTNKLLVAHINLLNNQLTNKITTTNTPKKSSIKNWLFGNKKGAELLK